MNKVNEAMINSAQDGQDHLDGQATLTAMGITPNRIGEIMRKLSLRKDVQ